MSAKPYTLHRGDSLEVLRTMPADSIDAIVCDPPYGLSSEPDMAEVLRHWLAGDDYAHKGGGFMGKSWDSFVPGPAIWREALRVLKPGGHLLAFFGTRTQDIGTLAIRLAGFEIRDSIDRIYDGAEDIDQFIESLNPTQRDAFLRLQDRGDARMSWLYGSGFPKSMDVSKAIDKPGPSPEVSFIKFGAHYEQRRQASRLTHAQVCAAGGWHGAVNHGGASVNWAKGYAMPTLGQWDVLQPLLGLDEEWRGFVREQFEREVIGTRKASAGVAFSSEGPTELNITAPATDAARQWAGFGTALKPAHEPITVARKPLKGTVAANVLQFGTGALNIDGCRVAGDVPTTTRGNSFGRMNDDGWQESQTTFAPSQHGRWPANIITDGSAEVVALFPAAGGGDNRGQCDGRRPGGFGNVGSANGNGTPNAAVDADSGSAARFFYCAKASKTDRDEGLDAFAEQITDVLAGHRSRRMEEIKRPDGAEPARGRNIHPTVKPTELMAHLVRLVTPPGGTVLDPFMGSGSTGKACMREGFTFIGIDRDADDKGNPLGYLAIAEARIEHELAQLAIAAEAAARAAAQLDLFADSAA